MDMILKDSKAIIYHYSCNKAIQGNMLENDDMTAEVELPYKNLIASIEEGNPLVIIYKANSDELQLRGCHVTGVFSSKSAVSVEFDMELPERKQRYFERLPVSMTADIKDGISKKRYIGIVKDISRNGLLLYSRDAIPVDSRVEVDIYFENVMVSLEAIVKRNFESPDYKCYGLFIPENDILSRNNLCKCIKQICDSYTKKVTEKLNMVSNFVAFEYPNNQMKDSMEQMLNKSAKKFDEVLKRWKS